MGSISLIDLLSHADLASAIGIKPSSRPEQLLHEFLEREYRNRIFPREDVGVLQEKVDDLINEIEEWREKVERRELETLLPGPVLAGPSETSLFQFLGSVLPEDG